MVERAGCVSGSRGFGPRKFNGITYDVYRVYVASQCCDFDYRKQSKLTQENKSRMEHDRRALKSSGKKVRTLKVGVEMYVLYIKRG